MQMKAEIENLQEQLTFFKARAERLELENVGVLSIDRSID